MEEKEGGREREGKRRWKGIHMTLQAHPPVLPTTGTPPCLLLLLLWCRRTVTPNRTIPLAGHVGRGARFRRRLG